MGQHLLLKEKVIKWLKRAYLIGDYFLYCHDVTVWFRDDSVEKNCPKDAQQCLGSKGELAQNFYSWSLFENLCIIFCVDTSAPAIVL